LRDTVAERPVLFLDLDQVHPHIATGNAQGFVQAVGDRLVERLLLFERAAFVQRDLNHHQSRRTLDAEVYGVEDEVLFVVLGEDLEVVVLGDVDRLAHGLVDDLAGALREAGVGPFEDVDSNQGHGALLFKWRRLVYDR
jgi:hypothetical protein